jgi:hypothetical protein
MTISLPGANHDVPGPGIAVREGAGKDDATGGKPKAQQVAGLK